MEVKHESWKEAHEQFKKEWWTRVCQEEGYKITRIAERTGADIGTIYTYVKRFKIFAVKSKSTLL